MGIQYSGSSIVYEEFDNSTTQLTLDGLKNALVNAGWTLTNSVGGYTLVSGRTPQYLQCQVRLTSSGSLVTVQLNNIDATLTLLPMALKISSGRRLKVIANRYQFFTFLYQSYNTPGTSVMGGVPYIFPHLTALPIANVIPGTPTVVETVSNHNILEGSSIFIDQVQGTSLGGINSSWSVQVVSSKQLRLVGSAFSPSAVYTNGTGILAGAGKIARMIWSLADADSNGNTLKASLRQSVYANNASTRQSLALNQFSWVLDDLNRPGRLGIITPPYGYRWYNNQFINSEPYIVGGAANIDVTADILAQLWDAAAVNYGFQGDLTTSFDGHGWSNYTGQAPSINQNGALFLAVS
jgi:hypothetical protein